MFLAAITTFAQPLNSMLLAWLKPFSSCWVGITLFMLLLLREQTKSKSTARYHDHYCCGADNFLRQALRVEPCGRERFLHLSEHTFFSPLVLLQRLLCAPIRPSDLR